jgi:hypothetical protein
MEQLKEGAKALDSVSPGLCGSTNVMWDCYLDKESNLLLALNPTKLHHAIQEAIGESGMILRTSLLDVWLANHHGPASTFDSLEESHVRSEMWPEVLHVQGESQLCNFSRDNFRITLQLTERIFAMINPELVYAMVIKRGPSRQPMEPVGQYKFERKQGVLTYDW